jgi:hypothetical protein
MKYSEEELAAAVWEIVAGRREADVASEYQISLPALRACYKLFRETGYVRKPKAERKLLGPDEMKLLQQAVTDCPTWYLDEFQGYLERLRNVHVSLPTILRGLQVGRHFFRVSIDAATCRLWAALARRCK